MAMKFDDMMTRKKPVEARAQLVLDPQWAEEVNNAKARVVKAEQSRKIIDAVSGLGESGDDESMRSQIIEAEVEIEEAKAAHAKLLERADELVVKFRFRALSAVEFDELAAAHRPTQDQRAEAKRNGLNPPAWNVDTFPLALVQASIVEPAWTADDLATMWEDERFNASELRALYSAADSATAGRRMVDLGED